MIINFTVIIIIQMLESRCEGALSDEFQYANVFELSLAVGYTNNDLDDIGKAVKPLQDQ